MKDYLNRDERQNLAFYLTLLGLNNILLEKTDNFSKEEIKCMKYITKWLHNFVLALVDRVGVKEYDRLVDIIDKNEVIFRPRNYDGQMLIDKESMEGALKYAVEAHCTNCQHGVDYYNTCDLYKCMYKLGMGSDNKRDDVCEFNLKEYQK